MRLAVAALLATLGVGAGATSEPVLTARDWRETHERAILDEFVELLRIPNDGRDLVSMRRNAEAVARLLGRRGVQTKLLETSGAPPSVYGEFPVPGAKHTLVFYAHYDGYPVEQRHWYTGDPFRPVLMSGRVEEGGQPIPLPRPGWPSDPAWRLYARSAADNKAVIVAMATALEALRARKVPLQSNLKFFIEGENEAGSPHVAALLKAHRSTLRGDAWLLCDGRVHPSGQQQLIFGVRGFAGLELTVFGAPAELPEGRYGGWAPNPAQQLSRLLASIKDDSGRVLVEGFYDGVAPLSDSEKQAIAAIPDNDGALARQLGLRFTEGGKLRLPEIVTQPSLNILGVSAGAVGADAREVIPSSATASLIIRLAKGMDHRNTIDRIVEHIRKNGFFVTEEEPGDDVRAAHEKICRVVRQPGYNAMRTPLDLEISKRVIAAVEAARGPVIKIPSLGGSLPIAVLQDIVRSPAVIVPIANDDNNHRAANENIRLQNLWEGIETIAALMAMPASESGSD
ncbi:MAG: M20/M25/M40 family metallo-hydrolase [Bryobacteraceae bacterium]|nr:M20/M25/M40 family metallo-hydrolase [Bryobacteraceae bacterium]